MPANMNSNDESPIAQTLTISRMLMIPLSYMGSVKVIVVTVIQLNG